MATTTPRPGQAADAPQAVADNFLAKITVFKSATRELWIVFLVKFLAIAAYAVTNSTLVLWLSSDLGYTDQKALGLVAGWSLSMTIFTLLVGSLTDAIGLRKTFFLGVWVCIFARGVMAFTTVKWLALVAGLVPLALGEALGGPVIIASVRQYSNTRQRSMSFSISYVMMNVGFLLASFLFDWVRQHLGEHGHFTLPLVGITLTTYRMLLLASLTIEAMVLPLLFFLREGLEVSDEGAKIVPVQTRYPGRKLLESLGLTVRDAIRDTVRLFSGLLAQPGFYRLAAFLMLIAFLKLIFMQMYYVYPEFGIRELGDGAPVGRLWGINSILIIFIVPLVGLLTQKYSAYAMVIVGGIISAASVFIMAMPTAWFQGLADSSWTHFLARWYLGLKGPIHPYYVMIVLYVVVLSFGEAFYSPRVYEYAAAIAPKGQEASYSALSYIPFLLAKILVGTVSGTLLARYCPAHGPRHSGTMWLVIALIAVICPVGLIVFRRFIRVQEAGRAG